MKKLAALLLFLLFAPLLAQAQGTAPQPVILPDRIVTGTLTAAGTVALPLGGNLGVVTVRVSGTNTTVVATVQGSNDPPSVVDASASWTTLFGTPVGSPSKPTSAINGNGFWRFNTSGFTRLRYNLASIGSGSAAVVLVGEASTFSHLPVAVDLGALITNTAQGAATVNGADIVAGDTTNLTCVFNQTAHGGTPSITFAIQGKDAASGLYYTILTSAAITTADNTPSPISIGPGVPASANVSSGIPVPATWRVTETVGGSATPTTTGTVGCTAR